jgi:hypothetical protein
MTDTYSLGDRISNRIQSLQKSVEYHAQTANDLRSIMFNVATKLRLKDPETFKEEIAALELPATGCDGTGCLTAIALKDQINQLEQKLFEHESVIFNLTSQLGINPFNDDDNDSPCCPRIIPNSVTIEDPEDPIV